ncbi:enoyl-CoA hydratase-related protein (plasmid) [Nocardia sp. CA-084685]|uniref:enoyl-CoA hydratase-related protein n=1 Tax=Nocardia sp. CA-084685 TaxID=3239970 RepID=UPI003D9855F8
MTQQILLLASGENGLTRRARLALERTGRTVRTVVVASSTDIENTVAANDSDLIICPYLTAYIPAAVYNRHRVVVIHPGPVGDRGPSSLDWAITEDDPIWGVTAVSATEVLDAGPVWGTRAFVLPQGRKSDVYNSVVSDAAIQLILEAADNAADPAFAPIDQALMYRPVAHARTRPRMRQADRAFDWSDTAEHIVRRVNASDGSPGVRSTIGDFPVYLYDAHLGRREVDAESGTVLGRCHHAVEIACGTAESIWIGHLRAVIDEEWSCKAPAAAALLRAGYPVGALPTTVGGGFADINYRRSGAIGELTFSAYNGAMSTGLCRRLTRAVRAAAREDIRVLILRGRRDAMFSNGLHLGRIHIDEHPAREAWNNITAINDLCRELLLCGRASGQNPDGLLTIGAITGSAGAGGAGGALMPLSCDIVAATRRAVLDPHYQTMGLSGSELHTYTLPCRVGADTAEQLLRECAPIDTATALKIGYLDHVGPDTGFDTWLGDLAARYAELDRWTATVQAKHEQLATDMALKPIQAYEYAELGAMSRDLFHDHHDFTAKRGAFLGKSTPPKPRAITTPTPALAAH